MRKVLTTQSTLSCGHAAPPALPGAVATASAAKLKVAGSPVLLTSSVAGKDVIGCATPQVQGNKLCTKVISAASTPPAKLAVAGEPVLVEPITGTTDGQVAGVTPQPALNATANQPKLTTA